MLHSTNILLESFCSKGVCVCLCVVGCPCKNLGELLGLRCYAGALPCCRRLRTAGWGCYSSSWCLDFSLERLPLCSTCGTRAQDFWLEGLRVHGLQELWPTGLVAPRHVESSWTRDRSHVPCTGRQILIYCPTREVQHA